MQETIKSFQKCQHKLNFLEYIFQEKFNSIYYSRQKKKKKNSANLATLIQTRWQARNFKMEDKITVP